MRESIGSTQLFAFLMMLRQVDSRAFLLVEGDEDLDILQWHLAPDQVFAYPAGGKKNALGAASRAQEHNQIGIFALVDADLDHVIGDRRGYPTNVISTDSYDLSTDVLIGNRSVLDHLAASHSDRTRLSSFVRLMGQPASALVLEIARQLAALRIASFELDMNARTQISDTPLSTVVPKKDSKERLAALISMIATRSRGQINNSALLDRAEIELSAIGDRDRYSCAHDVFRALAAVVREGGGTASLQSLEASFRASIRCSDLTRTRVFRRIERRVGEGRHSVWNCHTK